MRKAAVAIPVLIIVIAFVLTYFIDTGDRAAYSSFSTGGHGTSLLFDTLRYMDYPVRTSLKPLTAQTDTDNVYIIIQPRTPPVTLEMADEMLEWVRRGGRLVFLCRFHPATIIDRALNMPGRYIGENFLLYQYGYGKIITGRASIITNNFLMKNYSYGQIIQTTLDRWNAERTTENIFFAEYYHGFHTPQTFVGRVPLVMRLMLLQMVILSIIGLWHLGKRFGNPVPYYEEVEREENEYICALARLYMENDKRKGRRE